MKHLIVSLGVLTLIAASVTAALWLLDQPVAAAVVGAGTFFAFLALLVAVTAVVVSWWSATLMQRGADLALRSQESDDKRDVAQMQALVSLFKTLSRQFRPEYPALPLPNQQRGDWLPALDEFPVEGEVVKKDTVTYD